MTVEKMTTRPFKKYELPPLPYAADALEPQISKEQLSIHHDRHHQGYVTGANANLERLEKARQEGAEVDMKSASEGTLLQHRRSRPAHPLLAHYGPRQAGEAAGHPAAPLLIL